MTKVTKSAVLSDEVQPITSPAVASPADNSTAVRPGIIEITEASHIALAAAAHLIRCGYVPVPGLAPQFYASTGMATIALCLGSPDSHSVKVAEDAVAYAVAIQKREFDKEVEAAAAKLVEKAAQAAKQAELAQQIAEQRKALKALEATAAAL